MGTVHRLHVPSPAARASTDVRGQTSYCIGLGRVGKAAVAIAVICAGLVVTISSVRLDTARVTLVRFSPSR